MQSILPAFDDCRIFERHSQNCGNRAGTKHERHRERNKGDITLMPRRSRVLSMPLIGWLPLLILRRVPIAAAHHTASFDILLIGKVA
jgi:hypothetical protein